MCVSICCSSVEGPSLIPTVVLHSAFIACEKTQIRCLFALAVVMTPLLSKSPWPDIPHIAVPASSFNLTLGAVAPGGLQRAQQQHGGLGWMCVMWKHTAAVPVLLSPLNFP